MIYLGLVTTLVSRIIVLARVFDWEVEKLRDKVTSGAYEGLRGKAYSREKKSLESWEDVKIFGWDL